MDERCVVLAGQDIQVFDSALRRQYSIGDGGGSLGGGSVSGRAVSGFGCVRVVSDSVLVTTEAEKPIFRVFRLDGGKGPCATQKRFSLPEVARSLAVTESGTFLAVGSNKNLYLYDLAAGATSGSLVRAFHHPTLFEGPLTNLEFIARDSILLATSRNKIIAFALPALLHTKAQAEAKLNAGSGGDGGFGSDDKRASVEPLWVSEDHVQEIEAFDAITRPDNHAIIASSDREGILRVSVAHTHAHTCSFSFNLPASPSSIKIDPIHHYRLFVALPCRVLLLDLRCALAAAHTAGNFSSHSQRGLRLDVEQHTLKVYTFTETATDGSGGALENLDRKLDRKCTVTLMNHSTELLVVTASEQTRLMRFNVISGECVKTVAPSSQSPSARSGLGSHNGSAATATPNRKLSLNRAIVYAPSLTPSAVAEASSIGDSKSVLASAATTAPAVESTHSLLMLQTLSHITHVAPPQNPHAPPNALSQRQVAVEGGMGDFWLGRQTGALLAGLFASRFGERGPRGLRASALAKQTALARRLASRMGELRETEILRQQIEALEKAAAELNDDIRSMAPWSQPDCEEAEIQVADSILETTDGVDAGHGAQEDDEEERSMRQGKRQKVRRKNCGGEYGGLEEDSLEEESVEENHIWSKDEQLMITAAMSVQEASDSVRRTRAHTNTLLRHTHTPYAPPNPFHSQPQVQPQPRPRVAQI